MSQHVYGGGAVNKGTQIFVWIKWFQDGKMSEAVKGLAVQELKELTQVWNKWLKWCEIISWLFGR
jgi:hypothetical protein